MRALLTPEVAPRTGIVLLKPGSDLMGLFRGRVLISTPTAEMADFPSGRINDGTQPLLDEPSLIPFFSHERVIAVAERAYGMPPFVRAFNYCQWQDDDTKWHHHEFTLHETESGLVSLCYSHDNQFREHGTPCKLDKVAKVNRALWIIRIVCSQLGLRAEHQLTLPELCWWACLNGVIDLIPESHARRVLRMPKLIDDTGPMPEALISPVPSAQEVIQEVAEVVRQVLTIGIDPESPQSYMARPKRLRWTNEKYTRWVKAQPCACCNKPADDPHHIIGYGQGGMGTKAHDLFVIPLCRAHHDELHRDMRTFEEKYGSQLELLVRFLDHSIAVGVVG